MPTTTLHSDSLLHITRRHTSLVAELRAPHQVLSTCALHGGLREDLTHIVNHQSCEGAAAHSIAANLHKIDKPTFHRESCVRSDTPDPTTALLSTAANMQCAALSRQVYEDVAVLAVATAGVEGNAGRAGDPARWHEGAQGWHDTHADPGTINILLFVNAPLSPAALVRAAVTLTEAKTSVLQDLSVPSRSSAGLATGTGTDQFAIAAPLGPTRFTWTGKHSKLGELLARAVREAVATSLAWQNGLEPTRTRALSHALGRYGLDRGAVEAGLHLRVDDSTHYLLDSLDMVLHDPQVGCAAYALAALLDRRAAGALPADSVQEALLRQCALLVCAVGGRDGEFHHYLESLNRAPAFPGVVLDALVLGWREKWKRP